MHGVAGSGKSALLRAFRAEAADRGATVVAVDGRAIEPTPQGFAGAVGDGLAADGPAVLVVDTAERLRLIDGWLRQDFLPSLPAHARVVLATRDAPGAVWRASFGELLRTVPLGPLAPADAAEVLRRAGLDEEQAAWVNRFTRGHPLSLQLAASAVRARPDAPEDAILPTVVQELAALYLDGLDAATREALDATCVLRRVTLSLLGAVVPGDAAVAFARLAALPFVELGREGLVVHDTVREAVAALLRASDPVRHRAYRAAAWRQIRRELHGAGGAARWARWPTCSRWSRSRSCARRSSRPRSSTTRSSARGPATAARSRRSPPATSRASRSRCSRAWWEAVPRAFRVARDPRGRVVAFTILCELGEVPRRLLASDPMCAPWRRHLREHPVAAGQQVCSRGWRSRTRTGAATSPCLAALLRDIERATLEAGPAVRRIYSLARGDALLAQIAPLGFAPLPGFRDVALGGKAYRPIACDLGPESVAGWVSALAARDAASRRRGSTRPRASWCSTAAGSRSRSSSAPCWRTCASTRAARSRARRCCARSGATSGPAAPTSSRSPCRGCAASSATARRRWRPCAASATGCARSERRRGGQAMPPRRAQRAVLRGGAVSPSSALRSAAFSLAVLETHLPKAFLRVP